MRENVGGFDRAARFVIGPALIGLGVVQLQDRKRSPTAGIVSLLLGSGVLESAITRVCPVNALLGIDTYKRGQAPPGIRTREDEEPFVQPIPT